MGNDNLSSLFTVPSKDDNDMRTDFLLEAPDLESDDLSDLTEVSNSDIMGNNPKQKHEESLDMMPGTPANTGSYRIQPSGSQQIRRVQIPIRPNTTLRGQNQ